MATSVKMSSKNQIVVPLEAREALGLVPGDRLLVTVREEGVVEMEKQPENLADRLEGALGELGGEQEAEPRRLWAELGGD